VTANGPELWHLAYCIAKFLTFSLAPFWSRQTTAFPTSSWAQFRKARSRASHPVLEKKRI